MYRDIAGQDQLVENHIIKSRGMGKTSWIAWICGAAAVVLGFFGLLATLDWKKNEKMTLHIGTYGEHIYRYSFDKKSLEFSLAGKAEARNASYVLPAADAVYAVSECGEESGAYSFDHELMGMASFRQQTGADPCFLLALDGYLLTADYSGGSISIFPASAGSLGDICQSLSFTGNGPVEGRQESSHIHQLKVIPGFEGKWLLATDLGADKIRILLITSGEQDTVKHISDVDCPSGSGPRHMEFSKDGKTLYCICELSGEVLAYSIDSENGTPALTLMQRIQADEVNAGGSADIHLHPSGDYLYTSHRLDNDGIAIFRTMPDGRLEKTGYARTGRHPRNFCISPDGSLLFAACRDDRIIQVFNIEDDGTLTLTPSVLRFEKDMPSSILFH